MKSHESPKTNPICEVAEILAVGLIRHFTKNLPTNLSNGEKGSQNERVENRA